MPIENLSWMLPAAKGLYSSREEIGTAWEAVLKLILGKKTSIAFTGMAGAGKTVLLDHLDGAAFKPGYVLPHTSQRAEKGKVPARNQRIRVVVVPGQDSGPRNDAVESLFGAKKGVEGVVHVVCNGYIHLRSQTAREVLAKDLGLATINAFRKQQLKLELEDLHRTCEVINQSIIKTGKPTWMIVAVTKTDLFYDDIAKAEKYYSPHGQSEFTAVMESLLKKVGTNNFRWEAAPVCSWLDDLTWNDKTQKSQLKPQQRDHFLAQFAKLVGCYCG